MNFTSKIILLQKHFENHYMRSLQSLRKICNEVIMHGYHVGFFLQNYLFCGSLMWMTAA